MEPTTNRAGTASGYGGATIAHPWEHPDLCVGIFGVQFHTPTGQDLFETPGITEEMEPAPEAAKEVGFLDQDRLLADGGAVLMQYWRSYDDLDRWARTLPHIA